MISVLDNSLIARGRGDIYINSRKVARNMRGTQIVTRGAGRHH
jgi:hypothetical protein